MLINEVDDDVRGGTSHYSMPSVNSRLQVLGGHISGGKFDAFFNVFCILGVFLGGIWDSGGGIPQEIAGNNTAVCHCMVKFY